LDEETEGALNADMMERLGIAIDQALRFGWHNVYIWAQHLGQGTHVYSYRNEDEAAYASQLHLAAMLADIYDLLAHARYGQEAEKIKYPRPWNQERMRIGKRRDAIPIADFDSWYYGGE